LPALSPDLAESTARELEEEGRGGDIPEVISSIIETPGRYPAAFIWLFREVSAGRFPPEEGGPDRPRLLSLVLLAIDRTLRGVSADKKLSVRIRSAFSARNFATVKEILQNADTDDAQNVKEALDRCFSISDDFRAKVHDVLVDIHHVLYASNLEVWELTDVIYSTAEGLEKKRAELDDLVMNVLPHIAEMIGKAAAEGDLSENAEYTGWLEQRDRMSDRANSMQADLKQAKVIQPEMAGELAVSIGSRVSARDQNTGETKDFTFLGPWDVDTENGIYSYRAPLSLSFMGKKPGDVAVFDYDGEARRYEIISICSAL
jgi:transcription elongation factor GreA